MENRELKQLIKTDKQGRLYVRKVQDYFLLLRKYKNNSLPVLTNEGYSIRLSGEQVKAFSLIVKLPYTGRLNSDDSISS